MFLLATCLTLPGVARAGTYWVSPTGTAAWGSCSGSTPLAGAAACSLQTANSNAVAGDTVYLRGGTYTLNTKYSSGISPKNSGTCPTATCTGAAGANRIVFAAYTGETPILAQANTSNIMMGLYLHGVKWIKVTGITFKNFTHYYSFIDAGSSYNEISYCSFTADPGYEAGTGFIIGGYTGTSGWSTHNWVHHNYFSKKQSGNPCGEAIDLIRIGNALQNPYPADDYNTVENNYIEYGAHSTLTTYSKRNVVKNNTAHNEPWVSGCTNATSTSGNEPIYDNPAYNGLYGHRNFGIGDADEVNKNYILVEGNRLGFASTNPGNGGSTGMDLESPGNIVRYNFIYAGMNSGIYFKRANAFGAGTGGALNYVYNNTIYRNGYGWNPKLYGHMNVAYNGQGIAQYTAGGNTLNVVKNNIAYGNSQGDICYLSWPGNNNCSASPIDTVMNNWLTTNGDPKFTNPDLSNTFSQNLFPAAHGYSTTPTPDLTLQPSSPAIDGGTYLTQATVAGSGSTTLVVNDAFYFQDGSLGSDLARGVTLFPDWIAIGTVTNTVQIKSVDYATNTITLASPATWSNGAKIWLYKKSDGAVVLSGASPDFGASEYAGSGTPGTVAPPTSLQTIVR